MTLKQQPWHDLVCEDCGIYIGKYLIVPQSAKCGTCASLSNNKPYAEGYKAGLQAALDAVGEDRTYSEDLDLNEIGRRFIEQDVTSTNRTKAEIRENINKLKEQYGKNS